MSDQSAYAPPTCPAIQSQKNVDIPSRSNLSSATSSSPDNSTIAAEQPCELSTNFRPEFGRAWEVARVDVVEART